MKRVLTDDRILLGPRSGVRIYLEQVAAHWPREPRVELVGLLGRLGRGRPPATPPGLPAPEALQPVRLESLAALLSRGNGGRLRRRVRPLAYALESAVARGRSAVSRCAGFFEPNHLPPADPHRPTATTVHDLSVLETPQLHPPQRVAHWRQRIERAAQWTTRWVCISETTAAAMRRVMGIERRRIDVIPLASRWAGPPAGWTPEAVRSALGLPQRYLVCLGTIEPRKNVGRLLDAYALLEKRRRDEVRLVVAGPPGWGGARFRESLRGHPMAASVLATGALSDGQAAAVVAGAAGLLYPSLYEGFGLPPLEAMSLGVPAAVSTAPSLVEVCGDAALQIEPDDTEGWAQAMTRLLDEPAALIDRGRARAAAFCWRTTAQRHHDLLESIAG